MEALKEELNKERDLQDSLVEDNVKSLKAVILEKVLNQIFITVRGVLN